jgi:hypothetical protein
MAWNNHNPMAKQMILFACAMNNPLGSSGIGAMSVTWKSWTGLTLWTLSWVLRSTNPYVAGAFVLGGGAFFIWEYHDYFNGIPQPVRTNLQPIICPQNDPGIPKVGDVHDPNFEY